MCISLKKKKALLDALLADAGFKRGRRPPTKLSVLRIAFDKKSRDVTREQAIARAKIIRVEWRKLDESTLFLKSIARVSSLARDKVRFTRLKPIIKNNNNNNNSFRMVPTSFFIFHEKLQNWPDMLGACRMKMSSMEAEKFQP